MGRDAIVSEISKLTASQRKVCRARVGVLTAQDKIQVRVFERAVTVYIYRPNPGDKIFIRMTPRGRILETKVWAA